MPAAPLPDRYRAIDHLASGGMGELHIAVATNAFGIERRVVTKRLRIDLVEDERAALMLVDEARIAARLYHRNIVQVLDVVVDREHVMLVLEYIPSVNLAQLLDAVAGPLPLAAAATIAVEVASGLHYTHERHDDDGHPLEIVHRDVSLPNILVGDHGHIKLTDFGVAKARSRLYVTQSASIKGKLGYMAPEQIRSGSVDRRADVFGLGVVLYEAATGVPLFTAGSDFETMRRVIEGDVTRPSEIVVGFPAALEQVILRAIATDSADRYPTAAAMGHAIRDVATTHGWMLSPRALGALVQAHLPPGDPPWRRAAAATTATSWTDRTTGRWTDDPATEPDRANG